MTKTLDELVELVNMWGVDVIHAALAAHTGCTTYAKPDVRKAALTAALRELIADAERLSFLRANYSGLLCTTNRGEVSVSFQPALQQPLVFTPDLLDDAIDDAQRTKANETP